MQFTFYRRALTLSLLVGMFHGVHGMASSLDEVKPIDEDQAIRLRIVAPETRVLPSHADRKPSLVVIHTGSNKRLVTLFPHQAELKEGLEGQAPLAMNEKYTIWYQVPYSGSSSRNLKLYDLKMAKSLVIHTVQMRRIDVHHVTVTRPDGSKYTVKGEFNLVALQLNGTKEEEVALGAFQTGLGLDVPQGFRYRVYVKADTEDGPMQYKAELDFTN